PRSSRTGGSFTTRRSYAEGGPCGPPSDTRLAGVRLERRRNLDLPGDDLILEPSEPRLVGRRHLRADLADRDAAVLQIEDEIVARRERPVLDGLDEAEHAEIDALHRARQDVRAEVRLVDVDAVTPDPGLLGRRQRAEAARARNREHDLRTGLDLV